MLPLLYALLATGRSSLKPRRELALQNLALRQQLAILKRKAKRPKTIWSLQRRNRPKRPLQVDGYQCLASVSLLD